jgi:hypothetical protein
MMSSCSACMVAGSRRSAYFAVSVMKCSLTTVKRSSRISPRIAFLLCGALRHRVRVVDAQGLDGRVEVSAIPRSSSLTTWVPSGIHSGMQILSKRVGNSQMGISIVPPPTCRQAPTSAGRLVMARIACPPPRLRSKATP